MSDLPAAEIAQAYERSGDLRRAIATYERYLDIPWKWRFEPDAPCLAWTMQRLAEPYRRHGREADAAVLLERLRPALEARPIPEVQQLLPPARLSLRLRPEPLSLASSRYPGPPKLGSAFNAFALLHRGD